MTACLDGGLPSRETVEAEGRHPEGATRFGGRDGSLAVPRERAARPTVANAQKPQATGGRRTARGGSGWVGFGVGARALRTSQRGRQHPRRSRERRIAPDVDGDGLRVLDGGARRCARQHRPRQLGRASGPALRSRRPASADPAAGTARAACRCSPVTRRHMEDAAAMETEVRPIACGKAEVAL